LTVDDDGWARLFVDGKPVRNRPVRRQGMPKAWVFNGAIYLFRASLLDQAEPTLYGDRVAAYVMPPPYGHNIDDLADWAAAERILPSLP
jgi:CMP-N-acetylneuraminic acid synthetase